MENLGHVSHAFFIDHWRDFMNPNLQKIEELSVKIAELDYQQMKLDDLRKKIGMEFISDMQKQGFAILEAWVETPSGFEIGWLFLVSPEIKIPFKFVEYGYHPQIEEFEYWIEEEDLKPHVDFYKIIPI